MVPICRRRRCGPVRGSPSQSACQHRTTTSIRRLPERRFGEGAFLCRIARAGCKKGLRCVASRRAISHPCRRIGVDGMIASRHAPCCIIRSRHYSRGCHVPTSPASETRRPDADAAPAGSRSSAVLGGRTGVRPRQDARKDDAPRARSGLAAPRRDPVRALKNPPSRAPGRGPAMGP